jgi:hypothetical protein
MNLVAGSNRLLGGMIASKLLARGSPMRQL